MSFDPVTAIFNFLSTPAGQLVATKLIALNDVFLGVLGDLIKVVHSKNPVPVPAVTDPAAK